MLTSVTRLWEILGTTIPPSIPVAAGILVAWLIARWRGKGIGFVAGAIVIELGYVLYVFVPFSLANCRPEIPTGCEDLGLIWFVPIYCGPLHISALAGGMYLWGRWRERVAT